MLFPFANRRSHNAQRRPNRSLRIECLDRRELMAADLGFVNLPIALDTLSDAVETSAASGDERTGRLQSPAQLNRGELNITGSTDDDDTTVTRVGDEIQVSQNGTTGSFYAADVERIRYTDPAGNDRFRNETDIPAAVDTGSGDDRVELFGTRNDVTTGSGDDRVVTFGRSNRIDTGSGDDRVVAFGRENRIDTGSGDDGVVAFGRHNWIDAGSGDDRVLASGAVNDIETSRGDDTVLASGWVNNIRTGSGDDTVAAYGVYNRIDTASGDDRVATVGVVNNIRTGSGDDTVAAYGVYNRIDTASGNDRVSVGGSFSRPELDDDLLTLLAEDLLADW